MSEEAWSGIDVQLKRRADLVPNLIETVKGYAEHERGVFDEVTRAPDARRRPCRRAMSRRAPRRRARCRSASGGCSRSRRPIRI